MAKTRFTFRRVAIGCGGLLLLTLLLLACAVGYTLHLWRSEPVGWTRVQADRAAMPAEQGESLAVALENRVVSALSLRPGDRGRGSAAPAQRERGGGPLEYDVAVAASEQEVNAWLEHRLRPWAANQQVSIPAGVRDFSFWVEEGRPVVAARVEGPDLAQTVSVVLDPEVRPDGRAVLRLESVRGGTLPLPVGMLVERLGTDPQGLPGEGLQAALDVLGGKPFDPSFPVDRTRQATLTGLEVEPDGLRLQLRVEPRDP